MIGQQKISSFFTTAAKRTLSATGSENDNASKKPKISQASTDLATSQQKDESGNSPVKSNSSAASPVKSSPPPGLSLTPEQKVRMEANKAAARARLVEKENCSEGTEPLVKNMGPSWRKALSAEFGKPYFKELTAFVTAERKRGKVYPPEDQVFTWTQVCDIHDIKVVILGQDPYHGPKQAHGLCFSVQQGIRPPPSLQNIFRELESDIEGFKHPDHGTLTGWARQGVLLLNACLTVRPGQANSHAGKGWERFTDATISWLNKNLSGVVFMLWGNPAQKKGSCIDTKKHHILKAVHPSPLSAHRGFLGCKHFSKCNALLKKEGRNPVDWTKLPPE